MSIDFIDIPDIERMRLRSAIEDHGGNVEMYDGPDVLVAMPNPYGPFITAMAKVGLEFVPGSRTWWPLGSDKYPDHQRHDSPSTPKSMIGYKGFWLAGRFNVPQFTPL